MAAQTPEVRVTDSKARLTLPKSFANSTLLVEVVSDVEIVIRKAKVVPLGPGGELPPDSSPAPLSAADWRLFLSLLDNPPPLPKKLKPAIDRQRKKVREESRAG
jgi:hypothetical protein